MPTAHGTYTSTRRRGRAAQKIAAVRSKNKPCFTPKRHRRLAVAINVTGRSSSATSCATRSTTATGYPRLEEANAAELLEKFPERVIQSAVKGMLPKNKLGRQMFKKFKVYAGAEHPHEAQQPQPLTLD